MREAKAKKKKKKGAHAHVANLFTRQPSTCALARARDSERRRLCGGRAPQGGAPSGALVMCSVWERGMQVSVCETTRSAGDVGATDAAVVNGENETVAVLARRMKQSFPS